MRERWKRKRCGQYKGIERAIADFRRADAKPLGWVANTSSKFRWSTLFGWQDWGATWNCVRHDDVGVYEESARMEWQYLIRWNKTYDEGRNWQEINRVSISWQEADLSATRSAWSPLRTTSTLPFWSRCTASSLAAPSAPLTRSVSYTHLTLPTILLV